MVQKPHVTLNLPWSHFHPEAKEAVSTDIPFIILHTWAEWRSFKSVPQLNPEAGV